MYADSIYNVFRFAHRVLRKGDSDGERPDDKPCGLSAKRRYSALRWLARRASVLSADVDEVRLRGDIIQKKP